MRIAPLAAVRGHSLDYHDAVDIEWLAGWIQDLIPSATAFDPRAPGLFRDVCEGLLLTVAFQL